MIARQALLAHLDELLQCANYKDYCPNGLQVAGRNDVRHIITGVSASQALLDEAVARGADAVLVHHGYFWKGEDERIIGIKQRRLKTLLTHDINLIAYHLPLDNHALYGNNVQLAKVLGVEITGALDASSATAPGLIGRLPQALCAAQVQQLLSDKLGRKALHIGDPQARIKTLAWCTGAAQSYLQRAVDLGVDAFITGEINEPSVHLARETGVHFFSAGHHATERYGVKALGEYLAQRFALQVDFIDKDNPV